MLIVLRSALSNPTTQEYRMKDICLTWLTSRPTLKGSLYVLIVKLYEYIYQNVLKQTLYMYGCNGRISYLHYQEHAFLDSKNIKLRYECKMLESNQFLQIQHHQNICINKASVHAVTCRKLGKIYMSSDLSHLTASGLHPIFIHTIRTEFKVRNTYKITT